MEEDRSNPSVAKDLGERGEGKKARGGRILKHKLDVGGQAGTDDLRGEPSKRGSNDVFLTGTVKIAHTTTSNAVGRTGGAEPDAEDFLPANPADDLIADGRVGQVKMDGSPQFDRHPTGHLLG